MAPHYVQSAKETNEFRLPTTYNGCHGVTLTPNTSVYKIVNVLYCHTRYFLFLMYYVSFILPVSFSK